MMLSFPFFILYTLLNVLVGQDVSYYDKSLPDYVSTVSTVSWWTGSICKEPKARPEGKPKSQLS